MVAQAPLGLVSRHRERASVLSPQVSQFFVRRCVMNARSTGNQRPFLGVEALEPRELLNGHRISWHVEDRERGHSTRQFHGVSAAIAPLSSRLSDTRDSGNGRVREGPLGIRLSNVEWGRGQQIDPNDFVRRIDNPYFPLVPGTTFVYEGTKDGQPARDEFFVTRQTKEILGVTTTVIRDRAFVDGELVEETFDWFAQDED